MSRRIFLSIAALLLAAAPALADTLDGTWKLISSKRTNQATGAVTDSLGANPVGFITYNKDGHMMVLMTAHDRPRPSGADAISPEQRQALFSSMVAYAGTYDFDGKTVRHHIAVSWNEAWSDTTQIRDVTRDGDRLIYVSRPAPSPVDGSMGIGTLVWERVK
jgi:hypothetical protein